MAGNPTDYFTFEATIAEIKRGGIWEARIREVELSEPCSPTGNECTSSQSLLHIPKAGADT